MKNKFLRISACCLTVLLLLMNTFPASAETGNTAQGIINDIINYKMNESGASSVQQWINGALTRNAGSTSEWYAIALSQYGNYDFSSYKKALVKYLDKNEVYSASSRQKYALALIATGSTDEYIYNTLNDSIGQQGVMSWIFGLHMLNNGYKSNGYTLPDVKQKLLSLQLSDGGWAVTGSSGDVDVTSMAVQSLALYYKTDSKVKLSIDKALNLLSDRQLASGDYSSYGVNNPESATQVLVALSSLGIDCKTDSRFIKNGNTLFDAISNYQLDNGSFCHKQGGVFSETSTVQVLYSMVSYVRMLSGKTSLYILDGRNPSGLKVPETESSISDDKASFAEKSDAVDKKYDDTSKVDNKTSSETDGNSSVTVKSSDKSEKQSEKVLTDSDDTELTTASASIESYDESKSATEINSEENNSSADTANDNSTNSTMDNDVKISYKLWVSLAILAVATGFSIVLIITKKKNKKNFILIFAVSAVLIILVCVTDFQTNDDYYSNDKKQNAVGTVTLAIRCDTIADKGDNKYIPDDGVILDTTEIAIDEDDTVYDVLTRAVSENKIHLETTGDSDSVYVEGINHIYEFEFGDLSGWMYYVNGDKASVSCGEYKPVDGDSIEWQYTCELGEDLK